MYTEQQLNEWFAGQLSGPFSNNANLVYTIYPVDVEANTGANVEFGQLVKADIGQLPEGLTFITMTGVIPVFTRNL